ncbi:endolytic transglycosylase MltG [Mucilaginibacter sp. Bleaf8]|uniref:endolytic transglycosylase MltG n=1 Tax=Mucilaginibacter sp. Bleaf8 TaxID=2834430 RepID=UPI001BCD3659|nr:endolytic transglycosylase MltG [Mucilaginibacter sp. Bleaf8]MBS7563191.1 endolytic transglycosylase MltG [Mucilaginibacter sp. Bleaf8]
MNQQSQSPGGTFKKFIIALVVIVILALGITGVVYYLRYFGANVTDKQEYLYIHTDAGYNEVYANIREQGIVKDTTTFNWAAHNMNYVNRVKPGKYKLKSGMSNRALINMLKSGAQEAVKLSFHNLRLKTQFAGSVAKQLEPDSIAIISLLDSTKFIEKYGFNTENIYAMFIPNTYQMYWNTTSEKFFKRMYGEYEKFWTAERKQKAQALNLSPIQVSILASIVDAEALHDDEMPMIAGLYLNRLKRGIKLEADPTVIFATGDFTIKRVLNKYLNTPSPYNTYRNTGLPPGPIMMPSVNAINSVLNYKKHDYIYMCAKEDFSGYHNYASNVADHLANARRFQQALNERGIKR